MSELETHIEAILSEETVRERQVQRISEYVVSDYVKFEDATTAVREACELEILGVIHALESHPNHQMASIWFYLAKRRQAIDKAPDQDNNT